MSSSTGRALGSAARLSHFSMYRLLLLAALAAVPCARAQKSIYVAPGGSPLGSGAITSPVNTIPAALARAAAGDTIWVRGGRYAPGASVRISKSGAEGAPLHIWAYPGETPVFDFTGASKGFDIRGSFLHLKGLVAEKAGDNGVYVTGSAAHHNIVEGVVARYNGDSGVQMDKEAAYNLLLNVDSYENYDAANHGENADGFAIKFGVGPGNRLQGCRAWGNSDDGYDFWSDSDPGQQGVYLEGNWAFRNGYNIWGDTNYQGDSNGFKLGHGPGAHRLVRNLAWGHRTHGFDVNGNESGVTLYNNTAYQNAGVNFNFDDDPSEIELGPYVLRNNISLASSVRMDASVTVEEANSWNASVDRASALDFVSLDDTGADGPRQPDGSLPDLGGFLHLKAGSDLIDAGVDVGLPFAGAAPDLGAYEFEETGTAAEGEAETGVALRLAGPNPFRHATRLRVTLARPETARLDVFDVLGRRVATLLDGAAGPSQTLTFDATGLAPGRYVVRLQAGGAAQSLVLTLIR